MPTNLKLTSSDGFTFNAYTAKPEGKAKGGVVVIQEVWGVNKWVQSGRRSLLPNTAMSRWRLRCSIASRWALRARITRRARSAR